MTTGPAQPPEQLPLAALFPEADRGQWQQLVAAALRKSGRIAPDAAADTVEAVLTSLSYDRIGVRPLYTAEDAPPIEAAGVPGAAPFVRGTGAVEVTPAGWDVRALHSDPDPEATREAVIDDLENGVGSLWLKVGAGGLSLGSLDQVLRDVHLDLAPVVLDAGVDTEAAAAEFFDVVAGRGVSPESVRGNLGADPIGLRARLGHPQAGPDLELVSRLARRCSAQAPGVRAVTVDATVHHDAGGSDAEELGASLATGVAYLRALTGAGLDLEQAFGQLEFRYAAGADQFFTIAKFRAARRLWARVAQVSGVEGSGGQRQHAVTSSAMMTRRDPWVNLLRTTLACFGAGVGGAGAVTVLPFDAALGLPAGFARRLARNTSSLLVLEAHVGRVVDPAGGSWFVEQLTDDLAGSAWAWFTEIERHGGIVAAQDDGLVGRRLADTWARRVDNLAHRRDAVTGVSEFPDLTEEPLLRAPDPSSVDAAGGSLPRYRYAQEYEALRDAADAHTVRTGHRPAVFLATVGPVAAHTARAGFAANLFQAGGFTTPTSGVSTDPDEIVAGYRASGARVVCLASSDRNYAEYAVAVASALTAAGAGAIWLAGRPGERGPEYAAAGIDGYVFAGVNALGVLRDVHHQAGIDS
jgi:methylmalonyl-CoA mutase